MDSAFLTESLLYLIVLVLSLTVHEFFHAWTAWQLGDDTAARMGRLTLNPVPHIDLVGTILLPLMHAPIGWAKPVPVNPARFRRGVKMSVGDTLVSLAGPLSNLGVALVAAIVFGVLLRFAPDLVSLGTPARALLRLFVLVNTGLAVFNVLPIPPLDGSHLVGHLVPYAWRGTWEGFARMGPMILMALLVVERFTGVGLLSRVIGPPRGLLIDFFEGLIRLLGA